MQSVLQLRMILRLAFPNRYNAPTQPPKLLFYTFIPFNISTQLLGPELTTCRRDRGPLAFWMLVPKTTVNKDDGAIFWKDNIRLSRKVFAMQAKPIAHSVKQRTDKQLRPGIARSDARHDPTSFFAGKYVSH